MTRRPPSRDPGYTDSIRPDEYTLGDLTVAPFVLLATEDVYEPGGRTQEPDGDMPGSQGDVSGGTR
jgi:hypothetical protein